MAGEKAGWEGVLSVNTSGETWTPFTVIKDVSLTLARGAEESTTRADQGWQNFTPGLANWGVSFDALWIPGDTALEALKDAIIAGTKVNVKILDEANGEGPSGAMLVTDFPRNEALAPAQTISITLQGCGKPTWNEAPEECGEEACGEEACGEEACGEEA